MLFDSIKVPALDQLNEVILNEKSGKACRFIIDIYGDFHLINDNNNIDPILIAVIDNEKIENIQSNFGKDAVLYDLDPYGRYVHYLELYLEYLKSGMTITAPLCIGINKYCNDIEGLYEELNHHITQEIPLYL